MNTKEQIAENIKKIKDDIGGRAKILAATKTVPPELINFALDCGINLIGENRVNELLEKYEHIDKNRCEIHFIGHLQTNKVKYIIDKVSLIHSVDRESLVEEIEYQAAKHNLVMPILVEVNIGNEESKSGIQPEKVLSFCEYISKFPHIKLCGLMAIPPKCEKSEENRQYFSKMKQIFIDISNKNVDNSNVGILSLGMSDDYLVAVEEGSDIVRIGSGIFGKRDYPVKNQHN